MNIFTKMSNMLLVSKAFNSGVDNEAIEEALHALRNASHFGTALIKHVDDIPWGDKDVYEYEFMFPTEEGYNQEGLTIKRFDDHLEFEKSNGGRDCDGVSGSTRTFHGKILEDGTLEWKQKSSSNYDQYAEAAGY